MNVAHNQHPDVYEVNLFDLKSKVEPARKKMLPLSSHATRVRKEELAILFYKSMELSKNGVETNSNGLMDLMSYFC